MPLEIYKRGEIFHYRGTVGPAGRRRRLRGSCQTKDKDIAARLVAEIEKRYWDGHFEGPGAILSFEQACVLFENANRSTRYLAPVRKYLGGTFVKEITPGLIRQMATDLYGHATPAARNRLAITPAQSVINHAADLELCARIKVKRFSEGKKAKTPATLEWVLAFQKAAKPHLGAFALFMYLTGCRPSEALAVERRDVNLIDKEVTIRQSKVEKSGGVVERKAHLPDLLVKTLAELPDIEGRPLFVYRRYNDFEDAWFGAVTRAGIERLTPHCCRHGFATALLKKGVPVVDVARLGGWASAKHVLETYGHATQPRDTTDLLIDTPLKRRK